ncbi:MAG: transcription elongation factor GreB [Gammaproteobacteria bacterium]|nr:transcription elongation factor GreB [Gammaproteobacteria bacterium]
MSRYRPPQPKKAPYITAAGMQSLQDEQKDLWKRRRHVVEALSAAAAEGDRSENAEYIYRKKELRDLDRRIRYLQKRLPNLTIVDSKPSDLERVFFGATVHLEDELETLRIYRIVGPDEFDDQPNYISVDSPLARSLLNKALGDEVIVNAPEGEKAYLIVNIEYL